MLCFDLPVCDVGELTHTLAYLFTYLQIEVEEEEIVLQPIGPGMQNLEPDNSGTLRQRSLTPVFSPEQQGNIT